MFELGLIVRVIGQLKDRLKHSRLFAFNVVNRDAWVKRQARKIPSGSRILDVGAGSCIYRPYFSHCQYEAQDFVKLHDDQCRRDGYGLIDYVCDAANIPVADGTFDAVLCTEVLEHLPDPIQAVREFARILRTGGRLILTAPLGSGLHQEPYHFYGGYTPFWYERFLTEADFEQIQVEPNAGGPLFFAQEAIRFLRATRPFALGMPWLKELLWMPLWLLLLPVLGLMVPLAAIVLDRYDRKPRFTVGYHVTAVRSQRACD